MGMTWPRRAVYRVRQFVRAVVACIRPLAADERAEARTWLPESAWPLFDAMPRNDQRHSLNVLHALRAMDCDDPALMQAALLHDVAKSACGVTLVHRVAAVLLKALQPNWAAAMAQPEAPARSDLRYPLWAHAVHPQLGAEMAAAAGCDAVAVALIRRHQEPQRSAADRATINDPTDSLLAALQTADDNN